MKLHSYDINKKYQTSVAYFSMEFAIDQALKIYSGGLGFLAGSHMRSAYDLKQNMVGIGMLWSYGYYDQTRNEDRSLKPSYTRKFYYFLEELDVHVTVKIHNEEVRIKAFLLHPEIFGTAPVILLSTDCEKNDYLSRTITHKLYDGNERTRVAQEIVLGIGGTRVLEALGHQVDIYHMNEGHALPLVYELYGKHYQEMKALRQHIVFTTHTPEAAGNEIHNVHFLHEMGFFNGHSLDTIRTITGYSSDDNFSLTVGALRSAKIANAVSKIHGKVANAMWKDIEDRCEIISITNAQNKKFWTDKALIRALDEHEDYELYARKMHLKKILFETVADQTGKVFDPEILTIVWARRFAEYKRPGLIKYDLERFARLIRNIEMPVQIIWAGKPYPTDYGAIDAFNELISMSHQYKNIAVLVGYEIMLSRLLKQGSDIWLNTPRVTREASGTSGMTASMNGSIHLSIDDGWHPEFARDTKNAFTIPAVDHRLPTEEQDKIDNQNLMDILEQKVLPLYYKDKKEWVNIMKTAMSDIEIDFDSARMAAEYYDRMFTTAE
ncbi:MAG TPA: alpha-glucan family phosphorylase [Sulfurovum sp.]|nr:MAG: alpha-glucan family phosphorylase [Sulfurovum sp. 35-42-20]OYY56682.1 MAG: alpha-glucan family phosphorylase [Sulfurovum sp. 28-43-6]OYZ25278.1 MAG: alpha-glucan family phosphorylase [Sulfurovum sp. 16-42-52]OYZ48441.1 MAG: alpha-glucan family phosphorylase [Sulfurovum sp. 24-42-9]OZA44102.1 MAG: alpha-glucan family phosphorylase [Sulfurovum sp. 17-42-90]OZA60977.1 MAG: alpha-glucan family phosphorylase [Sulfurovum sp. 39-42-12]HQR74431.1 alpha-glucan family phosphorylase [Sulfurovum 